MKLIKDSKNSFKATIDEETGFLTAPVALARIGIQHYYGVELGLTGDRAAKKFGVFRPAEEVFDQDSVDSFVNLVSTNDHPSTPVTVANVKDLQVGTVSGVVPNVEKGVLDGLLTITDEETIKAIGSGKIEVSVGYAHELREEKGIYNGVDYDFVQTNIRANHLAIVDAGRCGTACKLTIDHEKEKSMIITIDGIEFDAENTQLVQAIRKQQSANDAEKEGLKEKVKKAEKEKEDAEKEKDKAEAAKDALTADAEKFSDDAINKLVADKAILLTTAKGILGDKMPECTACDKEIMAAVVDKVMGKDVSGKSDAYIEASFDLAVESAEKAKSSLDNLNKDFQDKDGKTVTRQSARDKYVADQLGQKGV